MNIIKGGVTAAKGFKAAGCEAQIKYKNGKKDMALVYSEKPCVTAGTFTTNKVFAAPVKWDRNIVYNEDFAQAVVVNSGVANACTGVEGDNACAEEAKAVAKVLNVPENAVLIGSTGVIGMQLPVDRICAGIEKLAPMLDDSLEAGTQAAEAIMTTDTRSKQVAVEVEVAGTKVTIGGMCKGAGMIHPNMATMLCYITTDCDIDKALLQKMTSAIVDDSFNMISVDGDTSTNDTALVLANGMAGNKKITEEGADYNAFYEGLSYVFTELSKMIAGDGEGCTCLFEVQVRVQQLRQKPRHSLSQLLHQVLPRQQYSDMTLTGEEFSVQWDILVLTLTLKRLIYSLRVKQVSFRLLKMERLQITARRKQQKYFHRIL